MRLGGPGGLSLQGNTAWRGLSHPWTFRTGVEVQAGGANLHKTGLPRGAEAVRFGWKEPGWAAQRSPGRAASCGTFTLCSGDVEEEVGLVVPSLDLFISSLLGQRRQKETNVSGTGLQPNTPAGEKRQKIAEALR